jgi:hypothetical protein
MNLDRWHQRYLDGETVSVWKEMSPHRWGELNDLQRSDTEAVLKETIARIAHNIELLAGRLTDIDYKPFTTLYVRADDRARRKATTLNELLAIPYSLRAFYGTIQEVNFMGELDDLCFHLEPGSLDPRYSENQSDPIVINSAESALRELEEWIEEGEFKVSQKEKLVLPLSPDTLHKHGYSGGNSPGILAPDARIDGIWSDPPMMFIDYLRFSLLSWGGFPGLRHLAAAPPILKNLCEGLLVF